MNLSNNAEERKSKSGKIVKINRHCILNGMGKLEERTPVDVPTHTTEPNRKTRILHFQQVKLHRYLSERKDSS